MLNKTIGVIFLISFFLFSLAFNSNVISDDALNVLMAFDYHWPHDIYCWGQDRGGTLVALLSSILIKSFSISALFAVSVVNYSILFLGFLGFSKMFTNKKTILLFALLWFLPFERFININTFPIGMSYSLIGFSYIFIKKLLEVKDSKAIYTYLNLIGVIFLWILSIWVSDLSVITIFILIFVLILNSFLNKKSIFPIKKFCLFIVIAIPTCFWLIKVAKSYSTGITSDFAVLNSPLEVLRSFQIVMHDVFKVLLFQTNELLVSFCSWIMVGFFIVVARELYLKRFDILYFKKSWINFFFIDFVSILIVIFLSHWVFLNKMGRWYFVSSYISFILLFLLLLDPLLDNLSKIKIRSLFTGVLIISISTILIPFQKLKMNYKPMSTTISELNSLGEVGIIADYWDAYRNSIVNPENIKSTPHEASDIKNPSRISEVFDQPKIFLSRDMWFLKFPDSISQFGVVLHKFKNEFFLGGSNFCEYKIPQYDKIITLDDLKFEINTYDSINKVLIFDKRNSSLFNKDLVQGTDLSLVKGKYRVRFYCNSLEKTLTNQSPVSICISSGYGNNLLYQKDILSPQLHNKKGYFDVFFNVKTFNQHVDFCLKYNGHESVQFTKFHAMLERK